MKPGGSKLFVTGIPKQLTEDQVRAEIRKLFPSLTDAVTVMLNRTTNKGYAFVHFPSPAEASEAATAAQKLSLAVGGSSITVKQTERDQPSLPSLPKRTTPTQRPLSKSDQRFSTGPPAPSAAADCQGSTPSAECRDEPPSANLTSHLQPHSEHLWAATRSRWADEPRCCKVRVPLPLWLRSHCVDDIVWAHEQHEAMALVLTQRVGATLCISDMLAHLGLAKCLERCIVFAGVDNGRYFFNCGDVAVAAALLDRLRRSADVTGSAAWTGEVPLTAKRSREEEIALVPTLSSDAAAPPWTPLCGVCSPPLFDSLASPLSEVKPRRARISDAASQLATTLLAETPRLFRDRTGRILLLGSGVD